MRDLIGQTRLLTRRWLRVCWRILAAFLVILTLSSFSGSVLAQGPPTPPSPAWLTPFLSAETYYITSADFLIQQSADTKSEAPNTVYNGDMVTYTIQIENLSGGAFTDIELTDLLPTDALEQASITCTPACQRVDESETIPEPSGGTVVISTTRQLIWEIARLEATETQTLSFSGRVVGQTEGSVLTNRIFARYLSGGVQQATSSDDLSLTTLVRVPSAGQASISSVPTWFSQDAGGTIAQDWGDFDLDGDLDLALGSSLGTTIYRNDDGALTLIWRSPTRADDAARLSYGVRWADVIPDPQNRPELVVVGDSEDQTATERGLNYIYAYNSVEQDFNEATMFASHLQLVRLVTGDFDGDGDIDLVGSTNAINGVVETPFQNLCPVNLYRNDGQGQFMGTVELTETHAVRCISENATAALGATDYDKDGDLDLALGEFPSDLKIMENTRDGQVLTDTDFLIDTSALLLEADLEYLPYDLRWADYDNDGDPELAAAYPIQRQARIYDQTGGVFEQTSVIRTTTFMTPLTIDWGDFNGDGHVDLVIADRAPLFYEYVSGFGFQRLTTLDVGLTADSGQIWSVHGIELGSRQNHDLAVSNRDGPSRLYTVSTPKLATGLTPVSDKHAGSVAWGDADGNGDQDLLLGSAAWEDQGFSSHLYLNKNGTFSPFNEQAFGLSGFGPHTVAFGDVDLDGKLEIAIGTPTAIQIYQYQGGDFEDIYQQLSVPSAVRSLAWGDANDDGQLDLLVGFASGPVRLYLNEGGRLESTAVLQTPHEGLASALAWGDIDGDYFLDFVVGFENQPAYVYHNNGDMTFTLAWSSPTPMPIRALALGDYDADHDLDLVIGNGVGAADQLWENEGGVYGATPVWMTSAATSTTTAVAWGDWESNGTLDLALGRNGEADLIYANLGSQPGVPQFAALWSSDPISGTTGLAWGDADGDGDMDLGVSHRDGWSGYYENTLLIHDSAPLADNPPYVYVIRPGTTQDGYFYSSPEILGGPGESTVTVPYVVYDPESDPINHIWFEYSLSGGTDWQTATPAATSPAPITQTTPTGAPGVFIWDAAADDALSDNARFRVRVTSRKGSGPLQDVDGSGVSAPFRVRGLDCYWPAGANIFTDPITPTLGEEITFEGRVTFANGPVTYQWDFGDGETGTGWQIQHTYPTHGVYTVTLHVYGEACPVARPALTQKQIEVGGHVIYLPLVSKNYTGTATLATTVSPATLPTVAPRVTSHEARNDTTSNVTLLPSRTLSTTAMGLTPQVDLQVHGQGVLQLTNYALGINNQPAMSGDGNRVAFWSTGRLTGQNPDGNIEIFLADIGEDGEIDYTQVTSSTGTILGGFNLYPALDHTGSRVVFFSDRDLTGGNSDRNFEVFLAELQDNAPLTLTQITHTEDGVNILPDISSDGRFIAFVSDNDLANDGQLLSGELNIFRADITDPQNVAFTQITEGAAFSDEPAISGDGHIIAFVSNQNLTGDNADGNGEIFLAQVASNGAITYQQATDTTTGLNEQPDLSTDGTRLVYLSNNDVAGGARRLYRATVDPATLTLSNNQLLNTAPMGDLDRATLSGDGTRVAYYAVAQRDVYIYDLVDDDTKERTQQVSTYPSLSSGGTQLAFASDGKIYVKDYPLADLSLSKTSVVTQVAAGDRLTYTLTVTNSGPSAGTDLVLIDELPNGVTSLLPDNDVHTMEYNPPLTVTHRNHFDLPNRWGAIEADAWMSKTDNWHLYHLESYYSHSEDDETYYYTPDRGYAYYNNGRLECLHNYNPAYNQCPQIEPEGKIGEALQFDGYNDRFTSAESESGSSGSLTISFWAKYEGTDYHNAHVVYQYPTDGYGWRFDVGFYSDDRFFCRLGSNELTTAPYSDTGWHHWACTYDATTDVRTIYRDGAPVAQDITSFDESGNYELRVGHYFQGTLDELAIYDNRALTPEEIRFQYEQQAPARTSPIYPYPYDEYVKYYSEVLTDPLGLGLWGALQWLPYRIVDEPLPDNQASDAYPTDVEGEIDMTDNLLLLHLDEPEGTGSFLDTSGNGNDASCDGSSCPQAIPGRFNGALRFDGEDDALDLPGYLPKTEDFTFASWVYWNGGSGQHIFDLGRDADNHLYITPQEDGQLRFVAKQDGAEQAVQGPTLPIGTWNHLAVTMEGDLATVWLNGERLVTGTVTIDPEDVLGTQTWLGRTITGWSSYFDGRMDEVAIFTRALDAGEIENHYLRGAMRIALQVRTCDHPYCNNAPFVGPDGSRASAFTAADDTGSELPTFALNDLPARPYFQYRVLMSSYTTLTTPSLISVTVRPQVLCEGQGTGTVTCQAGTETAPFPADQGFSLTLPTAVSKDAYLDADRSGNSDPVITNIARLENRESDHEPDDNETSASTNLDTFAVEQVTLSGPAYAATGVATPVTATVTPDYASAPITYTWETDLGLTSVYTGAETTVTEAFTWLQAQAGAHLITVTVDNGLGVVVSDTHPITAVIPIENAKLDVPDNTAVGSATTMTATVRAGSLVTYDWDFDDGTQTTDTPTTPLESIQTHAYSKAGTYNVTVQIYNPVSAVSVNKTITAANLPIENLALTNDGPTELSNPTVLTVTKTAGTGVELEWDFGDGDTATTAAPNGVTPSVYAHTFPDVGTYTVIVTATNNTNTMTATTTVQIVEEPLSGLTLTSDAPKKHRETVALTATLNTGTNVTYTWDFGDGSPLVENFYTHAGATGPTTIQQTHPYTSSKPITVYTAVVTATNSTGVVLTTATPVTITRDCWAGIEGDGTDYDVVQDAIDAAPSGALVKVAGTCDTVNQRTGRSQVAYISKTLTLRGGYPYTLDTTDPLTYPTTLDALQAGRGLYIGSGITVTVENLRITSGRTISPAGEGGGVYVASSALTLTNVTITNCTTTNFGGGLFAQDSILHVLDSAISHNSTGTSGGGMTLWLSNTVYVDNTLFQANTVTAAGGDQGGGGIYLRTSGHLTLTHSTFLSNTSNWDGGGLYAYDPDSDGDLNLTLDDNRFKGNESRWGAAALIRRIHRLDARSTQVLDNVGSATGGTPDYAHSIFWLRDLTGPAVLTNTLIANNTITETGGYAPGMEIEGTTATLLHTTVANNTGGDGVGVRIEDATDVDLINSIVASQDVGIHNVSSNVTIDGVLWHDNNDNNDNTSGSSISIQNEATGDPAFVDPPSGDYHIIGPASAAFDQGLSAGVALDIDGDLRDAKPDLGADEYRTCRVQLNDTPYDTVQAAVDASIDVNDVVKIAGTCTGVQTQGGLDQTVYLSKTLTLRGGYSRDDWTTSDPEAYPTTLDAGGMGRVLVISGTITPTIEGLRITGGDADYLGGGRNGEDAGGGVYVINATPTLRNNIVFNNRSPGSGADGGGIYIRQGSGILTDNRVISNTASDNGGGLALFDETFTLTGNEVLSNTTGKNGGGIHLQYANAVTLTRNVLQANHADNWGGALHTLNNSAFVAASNIIADNTAGANGDGLYLRGTPIQFYHTTLVNNGDTGVYVESDTVALTNTIVASHTVGISGTATIEGVLWYANGANTQGAVTVTRSRTGNPAFVDPTGGDYHLTVGSPAADTGVLLTPAWADIDGEQHSALAPDLGADETSALQITKQGPTLASIGLPITYTLTVTNTGIPVGDLLITDTLPTSARYVSGGTLVNGTTISWTQAAPLPADALLTRTFIVTATETITNFDYRVTAGSGAVAVGTDVVTTSILPPDLQITKTGPSTAAAGVPFTYTLTATNSGSKLTQMIVTDTLPSGAFFVAASDDGQLSGRTVTWDGLPNLEYGDSLNVTLTIRASETVTNTDYGASGKSQGQTVSQVGTADVTTTITPPDLAISKDGPSTALAEGNIQYVLTVTNTGGLATGVVITDRVPLNATFVDATDGITPSAGVLTWDIGNLPSNDVIQRTFTVTATQTLTNADYGVSASNGAPATGSDVVVTTIAPTLSIGKTAPSTATAGSEITYTLTVTNTGGLATGVVITDRVPLNATFVDASGGSFSDPIVTCNVGNLPYQVTDQCIFTVKAKQTITNTAYAVRADNSGTVTGSDDVVTIIAPTLSITKTAPFSVTTGSEIAFTLTVTNTGGLATGVVITDRVPLNANFVSAVDASGPDADNVLTWDIGVLSYTTAVQRTFTVTATQTITNTAYGVRANGGYYNIHAPLPVTVRIE